VEVPDAEMLSGMEFSCDHTVNELRSVNFFESARSFSLLCANLLTSGTIPARKIRHPQLARTLTISLNIPPNGIACKFVMG
jgi:hypothetical protein